MVIESRTFPPKTNIVQDGWVMGVQQLISAKWYQIIDTIFLEEIIFYMVPFYPNFSLGQTNLQEKPN